MSRRATTLLELLVAISLGAALIVAVFAFLGNLLATRDRIRAAATRQASIAALFDRLDADLAMAIAADASGGPGVDGDATSLSILTRGVLADPAAGAAALRDLQRSECRFDRAAQHLSARRSSATGSPAGEWFELDGELEDVRFRYHDGERWLDGFDSAAGGGLPMAVEVSVWFMAADATADAGTGNAADPLRLVDEAGADDVAGGEEDNETPPARPPDRRRIIAVPDARPLVPASSPTEVGR